MGGGTSTASASTVRPDIQRRCGIGRAYVGRLPRRANLPEVFHVYNGWGAPIAGPYLSRDEAQVGLILILEEAS